MCWSHDIYQKSFNPIFEQMAEEVTQWSEEFSPDAMQWNAILGHTELYKEGG